MTLSVALRRIPRFLRSVPRRRYVYGVIILFLILYGLNFLIPRQISFNYGGETCRRQLTLLPRLQAVDDKLYDVSFKDTWTVGSYPISSTRTCFESKQAPKVGSSIVGTAPFNGPFARSLFNIRVEDSPKAHLSSLKAEIPVSKNLEVRMSTADTIHQYELKVADSAASCATTKDVLRCDVPSLKLEQGREYQYELKRSFKQSGQQNVGSGAFKTLKAISITDQTVKPGQTVYARPKSLSFTTDKPIGSASVRLTSDGKEIATDIDPKANLLTINLKDELPREKTFDLVIDKLEAVDGSTLIEPSKTSFKTSGGPKVVRVSVGASGVAQSASIVLTFDQPLSKTKDVLPFISFAGGNASIQKLSDTQVVVRLGSLPLCQPFSIAIKPGIPSEHDLGASKAWAFTSRTTCYTTISYGTSLKGRSLLAYVFGVSGPVTMYVGAIHGNEPSSSGLMRAWIAQLEANPAKLAGKRVVVVPSINPDGVASGSRTNSRGVNLNRNFPTDNWTKSIKDTDGTHPAGGGEAPLSEPEASALARLTSNYSPRLLLSFHAVGGLAIGDAGGYSAPYAARYASLVGYRDGTNSSSSNFDYNVTGSYEDWTYRNLGIPSMVIELTSYSGVNNSGHYGALWAMLQ